MALGELVEEAHAAVRERSGRYLGLGPPIRIGRRGVPRGREPSHQGWAGLPAASISARSRVRAGRGRGDHGLLAAGETTAGQFLRGQNARALP